MPSGVQSARTPFAACPLLSLWSGGLLRPLPVGRGRGARLLAAILGALSLLGAIDARAAGVLLLRSSDLPVHEATVRSIRAAYHRPIREVSLARLDPGAAIEEIRRAAPEVVVAVGLKAALLVRERLPRTSLVYCMVPSPERHDLVGPWITGISADVPPAMELGALHALAPDVRRVGAVVGPDAAAWVKEANAAATRLGLHLEVVVIRRVEELGPQVRELAERADALWMPADPSVATPEAFRFTLELSLARRRPLLAFAPGLVRAGALAAAAPDLDWVAARVAESIRRIQSGARPGDVPASGVRRVRVVANLTTARAIGLELPPAALRDAELVR